MKRLHVLVIKSFLGPLFLTFFLVIFILLMQFLWKYIDDLVGKGLELGVLAEFLLYSSANMVPMALPLAVLLSSLMTFGNMAENLELLAFKTSGVSLEKIMKPLIFVVAIITILAFVFANNVMPVSTLKLRALLSDIQRKRPEMQIQPGVFDNTLEGYSIRIGDQDPKTNLLMDIWIYDHTDKAGNVSVTVADSGYMKMSFDKKHLVLTLYSGHSYVELQKSKNKNASNNYPHRRDKFSKQELLIEMTGFGLNRSDHNIWKNSFAMMNLEQLIHVEDSLITDISVLQSSVQQNIEQGTVYKKKGNMHIPLKSIDSTELAEHVPAYYMIDFDSAYNDLNQLQKRRALTQAINAARSSKSFITTNSNTISYKTRSLRRYQIEKNRKFSLSLACLIFFFIGAPLGAIIRKGGLGVPVITSVLFFLVYYMISISGEKFAREDMMSAFSGMWLSAFILIPLSIFLTYKASNDSVILNAESYLNFFKKLRKNAQGRMRK